MLSVLANAKKLQDLSPIVFSDSAIFRGVRLHWLQSGSSDRNLVFVCHGFPDTAQSWSKVMEALSSDVSVVTPFLHGSSRESEPNVTDARFKSDAILLDHLELIQRLGSHQNIIVVGHDIGSVHAINLARALGNRLSGLVIVNGTGLRQFRKRLSSLRQVAKSWYMSLFQVPVVPEFLLRTLPNTVKAFVSRRNQGHEVSFTAEELQKSTPMLKYYRQILLELIDDKVNGLPTQKRINKHTLVICGQKDPFLEIPTREEWLEVALNPVIRVLPSGHWPHLDSTGKFNELLNEFVNKCVHSEAKDAYARTDISKESRQSN